MKKGLITLMSLFAFVAFGVVSTANAYNATAHVYEAANGVGDALIFPVYYAAGTVKTNIRVINTSEQFSVVAKVVFREAFSSCETRDFLIFLSPNDVWTADIVEKNGATTITSDDDSSPVVPLEIKMDTSCNGYGDSTGYVEVYEAFAFDNFSTTSPKLTDATVTPAVPIAKSLIKAAYEAVDGDLADNATCSGAISVVYLDEDRDGQTDHYARVWKSQSVLAGVEELTDPSSGLVMPMVATALANNCNYIKLNVQAETRWDNYGRNSVYEVRAALSKEAVHIPYRTDAQNDTFAVLNFPIKLSCCISGSTDCDGFISACDATTQKGDECLNDDSSISNDGDCLHRKEFATKWEFQSYDMEENSQTKPDPIFSPVQPSENRPPIDREVLVADVNNFKTTDDDSKPLDLTYEYNEGWIRLKLTDSDDHIKGLMKDDKTSVWYSGSAVIPSYLQIASNNIFSWVPATYDCSTVKTSDATFDANGNTNGNVIPYNNCSFQVISPNMMP